VVSGQDARAAGLRNVITCDMGGTSTDVCLIEDLHVPVTSEQFIAGLPIRTPQIEINSVGAGGGSVAWIDAGRAAQDIAVHGGGHLVRPYGFERAVRRFADGGAGGGNDYSVLHE